MMSTRCFRGDRPTLTGLRLRRIVSFLRRQRLYDTAHALERQTGAFFDAAHFRRLLRDLRWADAASYVLGFIAVGDCSREADMLVVRILILRVMADLAGGRACDIDALFQRLYTDDEEARDHEEVGVLVERSGGGTQTATVIAVEAVRRPAEHPDRSWTTWRCRRRPLVPVRCCRRRAKGTGVTTMSTCRVPWD